MKWSSFVATALSAAPLLGTVAAVSTCSTFYGSKATTKIPTSTTTTTQTVTYATRITTITRTTTETPYTFTKTIGKSTSTLPTSPNFTPIISAKNLPGVTGKRHRRRDSILPRSPPSNPKAAKALRAAAAAAEAQASSTTSYPQSVLCTSTKTQTVQLTKPYSTSIRSATTQSYATTTTTVSVATVHAACQPSASNIITSFHGHALSGISYNKLYQICDFTPGSSSESGHSGGYPCMDPQACCEVAQDYFSGWRFDNATGYNRCVVMRGNDAGNSGGWIFYDGENEDEYFFGNGATFGGQYGGRNPDPGCVDRTGCAV